MLNMCVLYAYVFYAYVFWFAIIPYAANLINFAGYPKELDGDHVKAASIQETLKRLWSAIASVWREVRLRRLVTESMGWEGFFHAAKDYLQPALQMTALVWFARFLPDSTLNDASQTALLIGPVYAVLFLLSAAASRRAHRVVERFGSESSADSMLPITPTGGPPSSAPSFTGKPEALLPFSSNALLLSVV